MASSVRLRLPAVPKLPAHRKVTIAGYAGTVTFDITDPKVDFGDLADEWVEEPRPGGRPILGRKGPRLRTMDFRVIFGTGRNLSADGQMVPVHDPLLVLAALASPLNSDANVKVAYSDLESSARLARGGGWVISRLTFSSVRRRQGDNAVTRAEVAIVLTEASRPAVPTPTAQANTGDAKRVGPKPPSTSSTTPRASALPGLAPPRRYTLRAGDTLWKVATAVYGDGNRWTALAEANRIRDPRRLTVGAVLVVP